MGRYFRPPLGSMVSQQGAIRTERHFTVSFKYWLHFQYKSAPQPHVLLVPNNSASLSNDILAAQRRKALILKPTLFLIISPLDSINFKSKLIGWPASFGKIKDLPDGQSGFQCKATAISTEKEPEWKSSGCPAKQKEEKGHVPVGRPSASSSGPLIMAGSGAV